MKTHTLTVNGKAQQVEAADDMPLLWVLRDLLDLKGTKYGCGQAQCGSCTVLLGDTAVRSCTLTVSQVGERSVTTIEGLSENGDHPLQKAWIAHVVPQCGYCQAGQIMTASAFLASNPNPTEEDIENAMHGNICRCATYTRIRKAVKIAADNME
jgi:isoquinoline 1-oxidoreductase alpha subunit